MSQKFENMLNLALETPEEVRVQTDNLNVGFDTSTKRWEVIVKYHDSLSFLVDYGILVEELIAGYAILTVPEELVELLAQVEQIEYVEKPKRYFLSKHKDAPENFYNQYFENLVGVSHKEGDKPKEIIIRAHSNYIFKLTETKRIHKSQTTITEYGHHDDGEYGDFLVFVEVNKEFIGRILQMGAGLEIVSPPDVRQMFKEETSRLFSLYQ